MGCRLTPLVVMTLNAKYARDAAGNRDAWPVRLERIVELVLRWSPDVILWQEVAEESLPELIAALPGYSDSGLTRPPSELWGDPVFFRAPLKLMSAELQRAPDVPCKIGPYEFGRMTTVVRLRYGWRRWTFCNLHLCPGGTDEAKLRHIDHALGMVGSDRRVVLGGDMNSTILTRAYLELRDYVSTPDTGGTFNNFARTGPQLATRKAAPAIDMLHAGPGLPIGWSVVDQATWSPGIKHASDHWPVIARIG